MTAEMITRARNGWAMLAALFVASPLAVYGMVSAIQTADPRHGVAQINPAVSIVGMALACLILVILWMGFFTLQPNEAAVLLLFGSYKGTVRHSGFCWANPFMRKTKISL